MQLANLEPSLDRELQSKRATMGFPFLGSMVIVNEATADQLIEEILDCKARLRMMRLIAEMGIDYNDFF